MNNENIETVKSVSAGLIVLWILGILTIIIGLAGGYVSVIIAGVILLPIVNTLAILEIIYIFFVARKAEREGTEEVSE